MVDLNKLTLYHYCHASCEPFRNIMRLPEAEAFALAQEMARRNPETTAFYRFADFINYYPLRLRTDAMLYERFVQLGGRPEQTHPISFVLGENEYLHGWFDSGAVYTLALDEIPDDAVSFTLGDSGAALQYGRGTPRFYTKPQFAALLRGYPGTQAEYFEEIRKSFTYIEVQLWQDAPLEKVRRSE